MPGRHLPLAHFTRSVKATFECEVACYGAAWQAVKSEKKGLRGAGFGTRLLPSRYEHEGNFIQDALRLPEKSMAVEELFCLWIAMKVVFKAPPRTPHVEQVVGIYNHEIGSTFRTSPRNLDPVID